MKKLLRSCSDRLEAQLLKGYLESRDIKVFLEGDDCGGMAPYLNVLIPVKLFVFEEQLEKAQEFLEDYGEDE